jgi:hypothetical protein
VTLLEPDGGGALIADVLQPTAPKRSDIRTPANSQLKTQRISRLPTPSSTSNKGQLIELSDGAWGLSIANEPICGIDIKR